MILEAYLNEGLFGFNRKQELQMSDELLDEIFKFVKSILLKYNKNSSCFNKIKSNLKELKRRLIEEDNYTEKQIKSEFGNVINNPPKFKPIVWKESKTELIISYLGGDYNQYINECYIDTLTIICKEINDTDFFKQNSLHISYGDGDEGCLYINKIGW